MKCKICKGEGWVVGYGHACDGDERACEVLCPIQVQEPCEACLGTGRRLTRRAADGARCGLTNACPENHSNACSVDCPSFTPRC